MPSLHPIQRRFFAEELVRLRAPGEARRYVASQRAGRIDPNPHQIDAVLFALERIPEGGCILADEVGLGKTIEAGLVIGQLLAEGKSRVLLITPKALLGQWRQELFTLFGIDAREWADADPAEPGVFLVTRDFAGSPRGASALAAAPPFDLCVIDEAHEVFAGIYERFDRYGSYLEDSPKAKIAGRVRALLRGTPVLLLTATPIQNSLAELWGLAQFVEPTGTLLGDLRTFRELFCAGDDRRLAEGQEHELRARLAAICRRTLRRQAQEFMKQPFVGRRARLFEYAMSAEERALYDDVTAYLLEPGICAFRGSYRTLLLIGFHRRMASSLPALAASLEKVALRLEKLLTKAEDSDDSDSGEAEVADDARDLEDDEELEETDRDEGTLPPPEVIEAELARVRGFVARARSMKGDSKAQALIKAVRLVLERGESGEGSGKVIVFTESLTTQEYLRRTLLEHGLVTDEEITLFRGQNDDARARQALLRWQEEVEPHLPEGSRPSKEIAVRLALVHELKTRSKVFIATEAGAKGLNLQFADTLINYDLPWNPQRIEQRIGRIHRYGQQKDVTVINFLAKDNEAQRLTFEILSQKLDLFGTVLDASDVVLHESRGGSDALAGALSADFEASLRRIYERARTLEEIQAELAALRESMDERRARFEAMHQRTAGLIESRFDEQVRQSFRRIQDALPRELAAFDRDLAAVFEAYLAAIGARYRREEEAGRLRLFVEPCAALPAPFAEGVTAVIGDAQGLTDVEPLHLGHALVRAAVEEAREATASRFAVRVAVPASVSLGGRRGRLRLVKVRGEGFEPGEGLVPVVLLEGEVAPLSVADAAAILAGAFVESADARSAIEDEELDDATEELLFVAGELGNEREHARFQRSVEQIETSVEDRLVLLERRRGELDARIAEAERKRDAAIGADVRKKAERSLEGLEAERGELVAEIERLRARDDEQYARWMERAHARWSRPPRVTTILEADLELVPGTAE